VIGLPLTIRKATPADADRIGQLAHQFANYLRSLGETGDFKFNAQAYLRDGFGPQPAFLGIVAEENARIIGYLLYHPGYDTDRAEKLLYVVDLYVEEDFRGHGAGRALMQEAAAIARREGAGGLIWTVYFANEAAAGFYKRIGARYVKGLDMMHLAVTSS
jgi:GNAT superfamily N-acetyltransferase